MKCRICWNIEGKRILDLGFHPLADTFLTEQQLSQPEVFYPLNIQICPNCGLVQSGFVVSEYERYQKNPYSYDSSSSNTAQQHFGSLAKRVSTFLSFNQPALVVDIGSNIGTLLQAFKDLGYKTIGVEPALNIAEIAKANGIETVNEFINLQSAQKVVQEKGKASIVTATGVFNHIDDIYGFMDSVDLLLGENGVLVIEVPYLLNLIENLEYDTIYHEHVSYFSIKPLKKFFSNVGYKILYVERINYMGGSIRLFVGRQTEPEVSRNVDELEELELSKNLYSEKMLTDFSSNVYKIRDELIWMLYKIKRRGKKIIGIGAATKGNTLLNFCKIGTNLLDFITERSLLKIGKYTPGTHIPILDDNMVYKSKPDYALLLPWNLKEEIMKKFSEYIKSGGTFIIPIPKPQIVP